MSFCVIFVICVKKTISKKITVLRVINSSRHRNCFVRVYIHSLVVSKTLARISVVRVFTQTSRDYIYLTTFCCVVSPSIFTSVPYFDEPVGRVKIQTRVKILSDTTQQNV